MGRGGIAARKALAEKIERAQKYRLTGISAGWRVAACNDRYGRWELGHRMGSIVRTTIDLVYIHWWGETEVTTYRQGDARYEVDRGRWRLQPPPAKNVMSALKGSQETLTGADNDASIMPSPPARGGEQQTEEDEEMTTKSDDQPVERETYTAKQVATRIGTDAKTLRKFFRSPKSTFTPVGQGGRYEFDAADLPAIRDAFEKWKAGKPVKSDAMRSKPEADENPSKGPVGKLSRQSTKHKPGPVTITHAPPVVPIEEEEDDDLELDDLPDEEPTEEELAELEDLELDTDQDED